MIHINEIFPLFVATHTSKADLVPILAACLGMEQQLDSVTKSNVGGWQSPEIELTAAPFDVLIPDILGCLQGVVNYGKLNNGYTLINSWINVNRAACNNAPHVHPGSTISGVVYINVPQDSGRIRFLNPARTAIASYIDSPQHQGDVAQGPFSEVWEYEPVAGEILLFPSWLEHFVENNSNADSEPRVSIAFNIKVHE